MIAVVITQQQPCSHTEMIVTNSNRTKRSSSVRGGPPAPAPRRHVNLHLPPPPVPRPQSLRPQPRLSTLHWKGTRIGGGTPAPAPHREAGLAEDGVVVAPAGVADVDRRARAVQGDELGRNAQRAGAGERLHDGDAPPADERRGGAEDDLRGLLQEGLQALRRRAGAPDAASDDGRV